MVTYVATFKSKCSVKQSCYAKPFSRVFGKYASAETWNAIRDKPYRN